MMADYEIRKWDGNAKVGYRLLVDCVHVVMCAFRRSVVAMQIVYMTDDPPGDPLQLHIGKAEALKDSFTMKMADQACFLHKS